MAVSLPLTISLASFPTGFQGNADQYGQQLVQLMSATIEGDFLVGQIGGPQPTTNVGPWLNVDSWWFWDEASSTYLPSTAFSGGAYDPLINREMQVWQRQVTFAQTLGTLQFFYTSDRWRHGSTIATGRGSWTQASASINPEANHPYITRCNRFTVTTAQASIGVAESALLVQFVERQNFFPMANQATSMGVALRSSVAGTFCVSLRNADLSMSYVAECNLLTANVWQIFQIPNIPQFPTGTGSWGSIDTDLAYQFVITLAAGSNFQTTPNVWAGGNHFATTNQTNLYATVGNTLDVTLCQHNVGTTLAPFIARKFADELRSCQRYFSTNVPYGNYKGVVTNQGCMFTAWATTAAGGWVPFPVSMRTTPSVLLNSPSGNTASTGRQLITNTDFTINSVGISGNQGIYYLLLPGSLTAAASGFAAMVDFNYFADADY